MAPFFVLRFLFRMQIVAMRTLTRLALLASFCLTPLAVQAQDLEFPAVAKPCITCHGRDGRGRSPGFPNLCGQKSIYMNLTDNDIRAVAEYYEALPACK